MVLMTLINFLSIVVDLVNFSTDVVNTKLGIVFLKILFCKIFVIERGC